MPEFDLLVVGELNADMIVDSGAVEPRFGQVESLVEDAVLVLGSSGAITACGAAKLGISVAMVGVVGDDWLGSFVIDQLAHQGVDTRWCSRRKGRKTGVSVVLTRGSDRSILTFPGEIGRLAAADVSTDAIRSSRHVHVSSYFLQHDLWSGLEDLLRTARTDSGATTSVDPNWDPAEDWDRGLTAILTEVDYLFPNETEITRIAALRSVEASARAIARAGPCVVVKRGSQGALLVDDEAGAVLIVDAAEIEPKDTTGAGDTFDAGFLTGLLTGRTRVDSLTLASAAATLSTQAAGGTAAQPNRDEAAALAATLTVRKVTASHDQESLKDSLGTSSALPTPLGSP